jgi:hypothetical protein
MYLYYGLGREKIACYADGMLLKRTGLFFFGFCLFVCLFFVLLRFRLSCAKRLLASRQSVCKYVSTLLPPDEFTPFGAGIFF